MTVGIEAHEVPQPPTSCQDNLIKAAIALVKLKADFNVVASQLHGGLAGEPEHVGVIKRGPTRGNVPLA